MTESLLHRGPDTGDVWQDPDVPYAAGHRRLSILDLSDDGAQPMESASGRYVVVYNGEIYNFPELRDALIRQGCTFNSRTDTEILLTAIEMWGLNRTIQKLRGMYAFALWDRQDKVLDLVRDPFGKKPLYVGWAGNALVFSSELKAIRNHPDFTPALNRQAFALYMRYSCVAAPHSIYNNVWSLKPGHRLHLPYTDLKAGSDLVARMECYWNAVDIAGQGKAYPLSTLNERALIDEFETHLGRAVRQRMISDVPLGAFLSGGLDSSAVAALMQSMSAKSIKTFTIGFEDQDYNESGHAQKVADHLGTKHRTYLLSERQALDIIPRLSTIYDEPFADISAIPTLLVSQYTKQSVSVALSGDGGDELLGGYNRHIQGPKLLRLSRMLPAFLRTLLEKNIETVNGECWDGLLSHIPQAGVKMHKLAAALGAKNAQDLYDRLISTFQEKNWPLAGPYNADFEYPALPSPSMGPAEQMMLWDSLHYLPHDILVKTDRASMAHSLEVRCPFLDTRLYEFCQSLPPSMKIRGGQGKYILRKMLERYLPPSLTERPKQGFSVPMDRWLRGDLRDWAEDLLDEQDLETSGLYNIRRVRALWDAHLKGEGYHTQKLWTVLMAQSWMKTWMQ